MSCLDKSMAAGSASPSIYAAPATARGTIPQDGEPGLLSVGYSDQTQMPAGDRADRQTAAPQASIVEAIPTPTAFHTGGLLLLAILLTRWFRKFRWV